MAINSIGTTEFPGLAAAFTPYISFTENDATGDIVLWSQKKIPLTEFKNI